VTFEDRRVLSASLAVAADTRFSETRRAAGIRATAEDFGRTMLVCRMQHTEPHHQTAWEWFDYGQTLAVLPLNGGCSSVVITVDELHARQLQQLSEEEFSSDVERRLRGRLGTMRLISKRCAYPLVSVYAHQFVAQRYALIGDAAVGMHPVTAHGFNLGLLGAQTLAREITAAASRGDDIGAPDLLARYERAHRRATRPLYLATNALVKLYTDAAPPMRLVRHGLLRLATRITPFRKAIAASL
jgi:ubiquinone biosynthesis UbiH/UbiF/VisC/COQ6 family hydroxylase